MGSTRKGAVHGGAASRRCPRAVLGPTPRGSQRSVANGDPGPRKALCSHTDAVSQRGFWRGVESGWAEVGERWEWVAEQFVPGQGEVASDTAFLTVNGDIAYGVFIERWWGSSRAAPSRPS